MKTKNETNTHIRPLEVDIQQLKKQKSNQLKFEHKDHSQNMVRWPRTLAIYDLTASEKLISPNKRERKNRMSSAILLVICIFPRVASAAWFSPALWLLHLIVCHRLWLTGFWCFGNWVIQCGETSLSEKISRRLFAILFQFKQFYFNLLFLADKTFDSVFTRSNTQS